MNVLLHVPKRAQLINGSWKRVAFHKRCLLTLAIETSCDDTSVAIVEKTSQGQSRVGTCYDNAATIHFHETWTADSRAYKGIHPVVALEHHQAALPGLVQKAVAHLPVQPRVENLENAKHDHVRSTQRIPDFVTVTRGPGMRSNLFTGLDVAKGLAVAWDVPLVGVNHMQAHALTPRLVSAMKSNSLTGIRPAFPFLSLLVSGGHTMLIHSRSLCDHPTLASTMDIAIGDAIDKMARSILPAELLESSKSTSYGPLLERFAFPDAVYDYDPPRNRKEELYPDATRFGWKLGVPLAHSREPAKVQATQFSFSGLCSSAQSVSARRSDDMSIEERKELAREAMRVAFEHLASRVVSALQDLRPLSNEGARAPMNHGFRQRIPDTPDSKAELSDGQSAQTDMNENASKKIDTLVVSGGVAANGFLRQMLRQYFDKSGYADIDLSFPPIELCTDNAAMIGWAGLEMFEAGWTTDLSCRALRKWSLDPSSPVDGGILGVDGWQRRC